MRFSDSKQFSAWKKSGLDNEVLSSVWTESSLESVSGRARIPPLERLDVCGNSAYILDGNFLKNEFHESELDASESAESEVNDLFTILRLNPSRLFLLI